MKLSTNILASLVGHIWVGEIGRNGISIVSQRLHYNKKIFDKIIGNSLTLFDVQRVLLIKSPSSNSSLTLILY